MRYMHSRCEMGAVPVRELSETFSFPMWMGMDPTMSSVWAGMFLPSLSSHTLVCGRQLCSDGDGVAGTGVAGIYPPNFLKNFLKTKK